jgi:hypothetical protein
VENPYLQYRDSDVNPVQISEECALEQKEGMKRLQRTYASLHVFDGITCQFDPSQRSNHALIRALVSKEWKICVYNHLARAILGFDGVVKLCDAQVEPTEKALQKFTKTVESKVNIPLPALVAWKTKVQKEAEELAKNKSHSKTGGGTTKTREKATSQNLHQAVHVFLASAVPLTSLLRCLESSRDWAIGDIFVPCENQFQVNHPTSLFNVRLGTHWSLVLKSSRKLST